MADHRLLDHRVVGLPAHPASAGLARRLVEEVLIDAVSADVLENAQLLVSEVVTNAIVHARSDIGLSVSLVREHIRVEVADHSPHLPVLRSCDDGAVTGYGLDLVARLAADFGVIAHDAGKAVWFTLGQSDVSGPPSATDRVAEATFTRPDPQRSDDDTMLDFTLLGVPVELYCAWHEHAAAALREQLLINLAPQRAGTVGAGAATAAVAVDATATRAADEIATVNAALALLARATGTVFEARDAMTTSRSRPAARATAHAAAEAAVEQVDLSFALPTTLIPRFGVLREVLEATTAPEVERELLMASSRPHIHALRDWCCTELLRQASGLEPSRWPHRGP